jgi:hypothetical protein
MPSIWPESAPTGKINFFKVDSSHFSANIFKPLINANGRQFFIRANSRLAPKAPRLPLAWLRQNDYGKIVLIH